MELEAMGPSGDCGLFKLESAKGYRPEMASKSRVAHWPHLRPDLYADVNNPTDRSTPRRQTSSTVQIARRRSETNDLGLSIFSFDFEDCARPSRISQLRGK
ncbi:Retrovirus-related Pol polyprotein from transposon TNT 1-94, partial [Fusarium oxysporum f. sp. albedinis]